MAKWDDDETERPVVTGPKNVKADINDFDARMKAALRAGPPERSPDAMKPVTPVTKPKPPDVQKKEPERPPLPESDIKRLANEARMSAEDIQRKAGPSKRVRLRIRVSGWYPGSVPAVDYCDGRHHFFARAPSRALETADEYHEYWRKPFVEHLRKLGFEVLEHDLESTK